MLIDRWHLIRVMRAQHTYIRRSHHCLLALPMDSAPPKPKGTHGGRRAGCGRKKKVITPESSTESSPNSRHRNATRPSARAGPALVQPGSAAPFFGPYNTHEAIPLVTPSSASMPTGRPAFWSNIWHTATTSGSNASSSQAQSVPVNGNGRLFSFWSLTQHQYL